MFRLAEVMKELIALIWSLKSCALRWTLFFRAISSPFFIMFIVRKQLYDSHDNCCDVDVHAYFQLHDHQLG